MTNKEAAEIIRKEYLCVDKDCDIERSCGKCPYSMPSKEPILEAYDVAIKALEKIDHLTDRPCEVCEYHGEHGCSKWTCVFTDKLFGDMR